VDANHSGGRHPRRRRPHREARRPAAGRVPRRGPGARGGQRLPRHATLPIFVDHHVKTSSAARRLTAALGGDALFAGRVDADLPLRVAARFVASPLRERRLAARPPWPATSCAEGRRQRALLGY
jgi:hypothetical protein